MEILFRRLVVIQTCIRAIGTGQYCDAWARADVRVQGEPPSAAYPCGTCAHIHSWRLWLSFDLRDYAAWMSCAYTHSYIDVYGSEGFPWTNQQSIIFHISGWWSLLGHAWNQTLWEKLTIWETARTGPDIIYVSSRPQSQCLTSNGEENVLVLYSLPVQVRPEPCISIGLLFTGITISRVSMDSLIYLFILPVQQATCKTEPAHLPSETQRWWEEMLRPDITYVLHHCPVLSTLCL